MYAEGYSSLEDIIGIMGEVELFRGLSREQLSRLAQIVHKESYPAAAPIFLQESPADKMYIVKEGQVEIRVHDQDRHGHAALYLGRGQVFGEMALVDEGTRSASVMAVEDKTVVYSILNADFTALCESDTGIGYILMRNIAQDMSFKLRHRRLDPSETE
jgi:CRP/FNR family transcriptional regulator, cyclic AMP receptor protein